MSRTVTKLIFMHLKIYYNFTRKYFFVSKVSVETKFEFLQKSFLISKLGNRWKGTSRLAVSVCFLWSRMVQPHIGNFMITYKVFFTFKSTTCSSDRLWVIEHNYQRSLPLVLSGFCEFFHYSQFDILTSCGFGCEICVFVEFFFRFMNIT